MKSLRACTQILCHAPVFIPDPLLSLSFCTVLPPARLILQPDSRCSFSSPLARLRRLGEHLERAKLVELRKVSGAECAAAEEAAAPTASFCSANSRSAVCNTAVGDWLLQIPAFFFKAGTQMRCGQQDNTEAFKVSERTEPLCVRCAISHFFSALYSGQQGGGRGVAI